MKAKLTRAALLGATLVAVGLGAGQAAQAEPAVQVAQAPAPARPASATPEQVVEELHARLLDVMRGAKELGFDGRRRALEPILRTAYNLAGMARVAAGRHWEAMSGEQQAALVDGFSRMTFATYADRFNGFSGEHFKTLGQRQGPAGASIVDTQIVKASGEAVAISYLLQQRDGAWRIADVHLKGGISELATRRAEYVAVLDREGVPGLLAALKQKIERIERQRSG